MIVLKEPLRRQNRNLTPEDTIGDARGIEVYPYELVSS